MSRYLGFFFSAKESFCSEELIAEDSSGSVARSPEFRLRVTRRTGDIWKVEADFDGGQNFQTEMQFFESDHPGGSGWFGLECFYTSSRIDQFYFDDISAQPIRPDTEAPI